MCEEDKHTLSELTLEYMPRPADREIRVRVQHADISTRSDMKGDKP